MWTNPVHKAIYATELLRSGSKILESKGLKMLMEPSIEILRWAKFPLGECFEFGRGVEKDIDRARQYYLAALESVDADFVLRFRSEEHAPSLQDLEVKFLERAIESGAFYFRSLLATCFEKGCGTERNIQRAFELYEAEYLEGCEYAAHSLAMLYLESEPDFRSRAIPYLRFAASKGLLSCQMILGRIYRDGDVVAADLSESVHWFEQAVSQESRQAFVELGTILCDRGSDCYAPICGVELFEKALATTTHSQNLSIPLPGVYWQLGLCYLHGKGVMADAAMAANKFVCAVAMENRPASLELAKLAESHIFPNGLTWPSEVWLRVADYLEQGNHLSMDDLDIGRPLYTASAINGLACVAESIGDEYFFRCRMSVPCT